jgi:hypothetical protein
MVRDAAGDDRIIFGFHYDGVEVAVHFSNEHPPPHFHVKIPPRTGQSRSYKYPTLNPALPNYPRLTGSQRRLVRTAIERYPLAKFERDYGKHLEYLFSRSKMSDMQRWLNSHGLTVEERRTAERILSNGNGPHVPDERLLHQN